MSFIPYLESTGPGYDLETFAYLRNGYAVLPDPRGDIPFHVHGKPIPDQYYKSANATSVEVATTYADTNPLPFTRWIGTSTRQINQPQFLSVNETIYLE